MKLKSKTIKTIGKVILYSTLLITGFKAIAPKTTNAQGINHSFYNTRQEEVDIKKLDIELNDRGYTQEKIFELIEGIEFTVAGADLSRFSQNIIENLLNSSKNMAIYAANSDMLSQNNEIRNNFIREIEHGILPLLSDIDIIYVEQANSIIQQIENNEINLKQAFLKIFGRDPITGLYHPGGIDPLTSSLLAGVNEEKSNIIMEPGNTYYIRGSINPEALCSDGSKPRYKGIVFEKATFDAGITVYKPVSDNEFFKKIIPEIVKNTICTNLKGEFEFELTPIKAYATLILGLNQNLKYQNTGEEIDFETIGKIKVNPRSTTEIGTKIKFQNTNFGNGKYYFGLGMIYGTGTFINPTKWEELQGGTTMFLQFPNTLTIQFGVNGKIEKTPAYTKYVLSPVFRTDLEIGNKDAFAIDITLQMRDKRYFGSIKGGNTYFQLGLIGSTGEGNSSIGLSAEWTFCDILFN